MLHAKSDPMGYIYKSKIDNIYSLNKCDILKNAFCGQCPYLFIPASVCLSK